RTGSGSGSTSGATRRRTSSVTPAGVSRGRTPRRDEARWKATKTGNVTDGTTGTRALGGALTEAARHPAGAAQPLRTGRGVGGRASDVAWVARSSPDAMPGTLAGPLRGPARRMSLAGLRNLRNLRNLCNLWILVVAYEEQGANMKKTLALTTLCLCVAVAHPWSQAAQPPAAVAIRGGTVLTVTNGTIENGVVVLSDGKIAAVGGPDTPIPAGAETVDATGRFVTP